MPPHAACKLGRNAPTLDHRAKARPLTDYLRSPLPPAPDYLSAPQDTPFAMLGNEEFGDCTFAALGNLIILWCHVLGLPIEITRELIVNAYFKFTNGQDVGAIENEVLDAAVARGFSFGGKEPWELAVWASVPVNDRALMQSCTWIFRALYIGANLPIAAQTQDVWSGRFGSSGIYAPGSWGGHAFLRTGHERLSEINENITWGIRKASEFNWDDLYLDQASVLIPMDLALQHGVAWDDLAADYARLRA